MCLRVYVMLCNVCVICGYVSFERNGLKSFFYILKQNFITLNSFLVEVHENFSKLYSKDILPMVI